MSTFTEASYANRFGKGARSIIAYAFSALGIAPLTQWHQNSAQRRAIAELDDHLLKDMGLTRREVMSEANKPFWKS